MGDDVMVNGFVIAVDRTLRAIGPGLTLFGLTDVGDDPQITLFSAVSALAGNDNWGSAANAADASADLAKMTGDRSWTLRDTEGFASAARLAAGPDLGAAQAIDTEAFAAALRRRATPPPPAKH